MHGNWRWTHWTVVPYIKKSKLNHQHNIESELHVLFRLQNYPTYRISVLLREEEGVEHVDLMFLFWDKSKH
jgi:hypothetical protein